VRRALFLSTVFPHWAALHLDTVTLGEQQITLEVSSTRRTAPCPDCRQRSHRAHSRFTRVLADLPLGDFPVRLHLHARRFHCGNPACVRRTFRERLPEVAPRYQRRTPALRHRLEAVGFALGGQAGRRLICRLRLAATGASRNALLRLVRRAVLPGADQIAPQLRALGVDDFAFRRGQRYGAILVDLEQHRVLDLLPDREAATLACWLEQHAGHHMAVVSRDRGGAFAEGVRQAAPHAVQVADRFHLLQNLGQALDRLLTREHRVLTQVAAAVSQTLSAVTVAELPAQQTPHAAPAAVALVSGGVSAPVPLLAPLTRLEREHAAVEARRQARYTRVVTLASDGYSLREVARRAGVNRGTVRRYLRAGQYHPCATRSRRPHVCDPYAAYLRQRWNEGERNSAALLLEIQEHGFTGAASTLRHYVRAWRTGLRHGGRRRSTDDTVPAAPPHRRRFSPRQTHWILLRPIEELDPKERAYREALCQESGTIATAQRFATEFGQIIRTRACSALDAWLAAALRSHIPELVSFARGIRRDYTAVTAALLSPHSQGQVEGQVNRLKMLKRQTFGRANFDLLRRRVLYYTT
jgi:transposase